jgi:YesN/AraC family two-component response regulator
VLVTDFNMPKLSGLDLLAATRELRRNATLILASGYIDDGLHQRATALGVRRVLQKPYSCADLQEAIYATQPPDSVSPTHDIRA